MKTVFDNVSTPMRLYLHVSYGAAFAFISLLVHEVVLLVMSGKEIAANFMGSAEFWISGLVATALCCLMLYLHLPKMAVRCFTIGRKFGL